MLNDIRNQTFSRFQGDPKTRSRECAVMWWSRAPLVFSFPRFCLFFFVEPLLLYSSNHEFITPLPQSFICTDLICKASWAAMLFFSRRSSMNSLSRRPPLSNGGDIPLCTKNESNDLKLESICASRWLTNLHIHVNESCMFWSPRGYEWGNYYCSVVYYSP